MLWNTGSWSAGNFIPEEHGQHVVTKYWILISRWLYTWRTEPAWLDPDQQANLYRKNRTRMLLFNTGSWSAGDFVPEESRHHDVILYWILISRRLYTRRTGPQCCYIKLDPDQKKTSGNCNALVIYYIFICNGKYYVMGSFSAFLIVI